MVPIDQEGVGKEGIRTILERLQAGNPVLAFPEGNRTEDGRLKPLRPGIGLLVKRMRGPLIMAVGIAVRLYGLVTAPQAAEIFATVSTAIGPIDRGRLRSAARSEDARRIDSRTDPGSAAR